MRPSQVAVHDPATDLLAIAPLKRISWLAAEGLPYTFNWPSPVPALFRDEKYSCPLAASTYAESSPRATLALSRNQSCQLVAVLHAAGNRSSRSPRIVFMVVEKVSALVPSAN